MDSQHGRDTFGGAVVGLKNLGRVFWQGRPSAEPGMSGVLSYSIVW